METILVPVEFYECAPILVTQAVRFARAFGARVVLLHVAEPPRGMPLGIFIQPAGAERPVTVEGWLRREAERELAPLAELAEGDGAEVERRVEIGPVADTILRVADRSGATLVLMGTHGRWGVSRDVLGSVAEDVMRRAEVPVVTVRTRHSPSCRARSCGACASGSEIERALEAG